MQNHHPLFPVSSLCVSKADSSAQFLKDGFQERLLTVRARVNKQRVDVKTDVGASPVAANSVA